MPSKSKAQQALMGMAYAVKTGEMERGEASPEVLKLADSMTLKQLEDFASTKKEGLPQEVDESGLTGFLSAGPFPRINSYPQNIGTAWIGMERDKKDPLVKSFMDFIEGKEKKDKDKEDTNEALASFAGVASPQGTPGMGNVAPPSAGNVGSGDRFDNGSAEDDDDEPKKKVGLLSYEDYKKFITKWLKQQKQQ